MDRKPQVTFKFYFICNLNRVLGFEVENAREILERKLSSSSFKAFTSLNWMRLNKRTISDKHHADDHRHQVHIITATYIGNNINMH